MLGRRRVGAGLRHGVVLIGVLSATISAAGCGGQSGSNDAARSGEVRFQRQGFDITFTYPSTLRDADDLVFGGTAGASDTGRAGVGINKANVILVNRYDLRRPVTNKNVASVKWEVDGVIETLAGRAVAGRRVEYGGLPGYEYRVPLTSPSGGVSRLFILFDEQVEYFFNCQSTPEARVELDGACDQALETLHRA
jgi:hypothetical protein